MPGRHLHRRRPKIEDTLAYLAVLLFVGAIFKLLPASATTGVVWGILWRTLAILVLVVVPAVAGIVTVIRYLRLSKQAS